MLVLSTSHTHTCMGKHWVYSSSEWSQGLDKCRECVPLVCGRVERRQSVVRLILFPIVVRPVIVVIGMLPSLGRLDVDHLARCVPGVGHWPPVRVAASTGGGARSRKRRHGLHQRLRGFGAQQQLLVQVLAVSSKNHGKVVTVFAYSVGGGNFGLPALTRRMSRGRYLEALDAVVVGVQLALRIVSVAAWVLLETYGEHFGSRLRPLVLHLRLRFARLAGA